MIHDYFGATLAAETARTRLALALQSHLAKLVQCCRPSAWRAFLSRAFTRASHQTRRGVPEACCI